jgi:hypothetical protein
MKANLLDTMFDSSAKMLLGANHDINLYRVVMIYSGVGICLWPYTPNDPMVRFLEPGATIPDKNPNFEFSTPTPSPI